MSPVIPRPKGKYMNQSEVRNALCILTECDKKDVKEVLSALTDVITHALKHGKKQFTLHGCAKLKVKRKKARKAKKGINPFTREPCIFKAKPACNVPRGLALKALKEIVA